MRALRLHGPRDLRLHEEDIPQPLPGEVQIQVKSVGICASDLHYYREGRIGSTQINTPLVIGHEASGVVSALGDGVTSLAVGDKVAIEPAKPCMECEYCLSGNYNVCPGIPFFGTPPTDGCLREYITWPASLAIKVPDSITHDEAAMVEPFAVGVFAVELAGLSSNDTVVILGAGALGLSTLQAAKVAGAKRIIVNEPVVERRNLAKKLGADEVINPSAVSSEDEVNRLTNGKGADIVFECTGAENAVRESCKLAKILVKVVVVGIPDGDDYAFEASASRRKQLSAIFVRRSNLTTEKSIEWVAEGRVDVASLATHRFSLENAKEAMELAISRRDGVVRAIIEVS